MEMDLSDLGVSIDQEVQIPTTMPRASNAITDFELPEALLLKDLGYAYEFQQRPKQSELHFENAD